MILNAFASQAYIVISALNVVQRSKHCFLAKLWHKNDVFDEKQGVWGALELVNVAQKQPG